MAKRRKTLSWFVAAAGWFATVAPTVWAAMIASAGGVILLLLTAGARVFANRSFVGASLIFVLLLWTYIGLVWLITRKPRDWRTLRYGITFEGIQPNFDPRSEEGGLSLAVVVRNFSPAPIRYFIEEIDVHIGTRTLPSRYRKNSLQGILARGAARASTPIPFKLEHVREFVGKRVEGTLDFSIIYGDADKKPVRRLRMSHRLYLELPDISEDSAAARLPPVIRFTASILEESDEPIDS
jgi:hypothetical protein